MPDVGWARQQACTPPLALDVDRCGSGRRGQIELHDVFIFVACRQPVMWSAQLLADVKGVVKIAQTVLREHLLNLVRGKLGVIPQAGILAEIFNSGR
jgi:hypothetical protein